MSTPDDPLTLADWRRTVAQLYANLRRSRDPGRAWVRFLARRSRLFRSHPQSPLTPAQRAQFRTLDYFPYDPSYRLSAVVDRQVERQTFNLDLPADGQFSYTRVALLHFNVGGAACRLSLFWVNGYGGGLFLPFRDDTNKSTSYGGGRYLLDTIKGADLGETPAGLTLDFNFAYNPSCAYNDDWVCPLSPPENRLTIPIPAGEKKFHD
jgi:uncharacterized protein